VQLLANLSQFELPRKPIHTYFFFILPPVATQPIPINQQELRLCAPTSYTVQCAPNKVIEILSADFGRVDGYIKQCPIIQDGTSKKRRRRKRSYFFGRCTVDVTPKLTNSCSGLKSCFLAVNFRNYNSPCMQYPGREYLLMKYLCVNRE